MKITEKEFTFPFLVKDVLALTGLSGQELRRLLKQNAIKCFIPCELDVHPWYQIKQKNIDLTQEIDGDSVFYVGKRKVIKVETFDLYLINPTIGDEIADVGFRKAKIIYELR